MGSDTASNHKAQQSGSSAWKEQWDQHVAPTYGTPQLQLVSGSGAYLQDSEGRSYLDLLSGIAVNALGQAHPAITAAVTQQLQTLGHVSNFYAHPQVIRLAERLSSLVTLHLPDRNAAEALSSQTTVFFCNSGAEANEAAFKIARTTGKTKILAAQQGFHGRTMGALALTGQPDKQAPFVPLPEGVEYYPFGDFAALRELADEQTAAIILESIQGETGIIPPPPGFLTQVRQLCDELDILMIVDEVQAGMGRTGQWFGYQVEPIVPDVITLAKGLGGGLPIGACITLPKGQRLAKGQHGTTFGGNPVVCAAANAVIDVIEEERLLDHVQEVSTYLVEALSALPEVDHVRGRGFMLGVVLQQPLDADPHEFGLILNRPAPNVLRLVPPLTLTLEEAQEGVEKIRRMLAQARTSGE